MIVAANNTQELTEHTAVFLEKFTATHSFGSPQLSFWRWKEE